MFVDECRCLIDPLLKRLLFVSSNERKKVRDSDHREGEKSKRRRLCCPNFPIWITSLGNNRSNDCVQIS